MVWVVWVRGWENKTLRIQGVGVYRTLVLPEWPWCFERENQIVTITHSQHILIHTPTLDKKLFSFSLSDFFFFPQTLPFLSSVKL